MSDPYVGEIRMFAGNFAPAGWALCEGQLMAIAENDTLFNLIGTTYGGDGQETFGLPNLAGRIPIHMGQGPSISQNYVQGEMVGVETVTLTQQQMPVHNHSFLVSQNAGDTANAVNNMLSADPSNQLYIQDVASVGQANTNIQPQGASQPHDNMAPYIVINYIISLYGIYPTPT